MQIAQPAAAQRWRDEDSGGGRRESREGGELKGTEEREGESFRGTLTPSLLLSPRHSSPQFGLPWSCHGNREASKTRKGGWDQGREGGRENSLESSPLRLAVVIISWEEVSRCSVDSVPQSPPDLVHPSQGPPSSASLRVPESSQDLLPNP